MSIVTKGGDGGQTSLMYGRRVSKDHPRVEACGSIDELNAAMGMARALSPDPFIREVIQGIQKQLGPLMGEVATAQDDMLRYVKDGFKVIGPEAAKEVYDVIKQLEAEGLQFEGWALPGGNPSGSALDIARATCRRSERAVCRLLEAGELKNPEILVFLNRLSDLLWLLARKAEASG